jgi:tetratricopeptide (TPR) repeat protein
MNFVEELKRRKVLKTLGVYAAAAFIMIQVAEIVFPRLFLPDWTVTFVIVLVILGFPVTFFLTWTYDLKRDVKPDNKKDSVSQFMDHAHSAEPTAPTESKAKENSNLNIYSITGAVLACLGIGFWFFFSTSSLSTADENIIENSIAVFSFENLSPKDANPVSGEILQHLIISDLSGLTHLKVISHQRLTDIQKQSADGLSNYTIAQQANAKVLLSGSIMDLSGTKIILGDLIDAVDGNVITSHRIEGNNIYSMVDELTEFIRQDLDISKHEDDQLALDAGSKTTQSLEAYDKYLEGLSYFNNLEYEKADAKFQEAVTIDSTFFDAHYLSAISKWWLDETETNKEASNYCKKLIDKEIFNDDKQKLKLQGAFNLIRGDHNSAQPIYEKLVELDLEDKISWYALGETYYHRNTKGDEEREKYYGKADTAFKKALELDPELQIARVHIIHMLLINNKYAEIIKEEKAALKVNKKNNRAYSHIILAYESMEDSTNSKKYLDKAKLILDDKTLCKLYTEFAWGLGFNNQWKIFEHQTKYHLKQAVQYSLNALEVCSDDKINPPNNDPNWTPMPILLSYRAYDSEYAHDLYEKLTMDLNLSVTKKMDLAYQVGSYNMWDTFEFQFPNEDQDLRREFSINYLMKSLDISKKIHNTKFFSKSVSLLIDIYRKQYNIEKSEAFFMQEVTAFCGTIDYLSCFDSPSGSALGSLANSFYHMNNYDHSMKIYQYLTDKANLSGIEDASKKEAIAYLQEFHYRLGMMEMKTYNYFSARQNFIAAATALKENIATDNLIKNNWVTLTLLDKRIAQCYYKENNFKNAIKYYKEAFNSSTDPDEKMEQLSMLALNEYYDNQIDSAKIHFLEVEKYYNEDNINYDNMNRTAYYYIDWPLYQYHKSEKNTNKTQQYLTDAYNHIPEKEKTDYREDEKRLDHLHKYYYIHEIIEAYNQNIR